jgi:hypothetical protein
VFTVSYKDRLIFNGRSTRAAGEAKPTNRRQADGVRGRPCSVRKQPPITIQRRLRRWFPSDMEGVTGTEEYRAHELLLRAGSCQWFETASGDQADRLHAALTEPLRDRWT